MVSARCAQLSTLIWWQVIHATEDDAPLCSLRGGVSGCHAWSLSLEASGVWASSRRYQRMVCSYKQPQFLSLVEASSGGSAAPGCLYRRGFDNLLASGSWGFVFKSGPWVVSELTNGSRHPPDLAVEALGRYWPCWNVPMLWFCGPEKLPVFLKL